MQGIATFNRDAGMNQQLLLPVLEPDIQRFCCIFLTRTIEGADGWVSMHFGTKEILEPRRVAGNP